MSRMLRFLAAAAMIAFLVPVRMGLSADAGPSVGQPAPGFTLTSSEGKATSLSDYKGKWVVLYFYPKDFTGG